MFLKNQTDPNHKVNPRYTYLKNDVYYFVRKVPKDLQRYYTRPRIVQSLRTKSYIAAKASARLLASKLDDYWLGLRLKEIEVPCPHLIIGRARENSPALLNVSESLDLYLSIKGHGRQEMFFNTTRRNIGYLTDCLGNHPLNHYSTADAAVLRQWLQEKGLSNSSVQRTFGVIKAVINFAINEHGLDLKNPFANVYLPTAYDKKQRHPLKPEQLKALQRSCYDIDDDIRHLVALISDTGLRLAEAAGLLVEDLVTDCEHPHIVVRPYEHRSLKTQSSARTVPLVGAALWAANRVKATANSVYCFPRYNKSSSTNSNSASAAINKWIKTIAGPLALVHGMRHSFRDRLRAVEAPLDMIDQLGGWTLQSVGQGYGDGYQLQQTTIWLRKIQI